MRPLWKCPQCGHEFVTRNMLHSCSNYTIDSHFENKDLGVREVFDRYRAFVETIGPVTVYAQKTRIVFQTRGRFTTAIPRKHWLECTLWLKRPAEHPRFRKVDAFLDKDFVHYFRLTRWDEFDDKLGDLVREAYRVGSQEFIAAALTGAPATARSSPSSRKRVAG